MTAAAALPEAATQPVQAPPEPVLVGTFAMYRTGDGGFVVAWKKKGEDTARHLPIPAFLLQAAAAQTGRSVDDLLAELLGQQP